MSRVSSRHGNLRTDRPHMTPPIQVLILEDREPDFELILNELARTGLDLTWRRGQTRSEFLNQLQVPPDVILSDYNLSEFDVHAALAILQERGLDIPLIVISGTIGEDTAVAVMKQGASDYLLKDRLGRLHLAVQHAVEKKRLRDERRLALERLSDSERRFAAFMDHLPGAAFIKDAAGRHIYVNATWEKVFGKDRSSWWGRTNEQLFAPATAFQMSHHDALVRDKQAPLQTIETIELGDQLRHYLVVKFPFITEAQGDGPAIAGVAVDVTDRIRAEESLREQIGLARLSADVGLARRAISRCSTCFAPAPTRACATWARWRCASGPCAPGPRLSTWPRPPVWPRAPPSKWCTSAPVKPALRRRPSKRSSATMC